MADGVIVSDAVEVPVDVRMAMDEGVGVGVAVASVGRRTMGHSVSCSRGNHGGLKWLLSSIALDMIRPILLYFRLQDALD